jgi:hypothetical protein
MPTTGTANVLTLLCFEPTSKQNTQLSWLLARVSMRKSCTVGVSPLAVANFISTKDGERVLITDPRNKKMERKSENDSGGHG